MPIYEYYCTNCKLQFELMLPFNRSDEMAKCPQCNQPSQKLISNFASKTGSYLQAPEKTFRKLGGGTARRRPGKKSRPRTAGKAAK